MALHLHFFRCPGAVCPAAGRRAPPQNLTTARVKTECKVRVVYQTVDEARAALRAKGIDPTVIECAMMPKFLLPKPLLTGIGCLAAKRLI